MRNPKAGTYLIVIALLLLVTFILLGGTAPATSDPQRWANVTPPVIEQWGVR